MPPLAGPVSLSALYVYPVKGAGGIAPAAWEVDSFGLVHDRRWMVVNAEGTAVTQRTHPRLALLRPTLTGDALRLGPPGEPALELPLAPEGPPTRTVTVWGDTCEAVWTGDRVARWLSQWLGSECGLVYMPETTRRPADPAFAPAGTRVSFADGFPFLLLAEESLAALNARLAAPLPMNRFRPNLVLRGGPAFLEDTLDRFSIGPMQFRAVKSCARCVVTTTSQETAERGAEPLRTLATFRKLDGEVHFGQNLVHTGPGRLGIGDSVQW